jgi:hypothetical protein
MLRGGSPVVPALEMVASTLSFPAVGHPAGGGATAEHAGASVLPVNGRSLDTGSRIVAHSDGRLLSLPTGTNRAVEEGADRMTINRGRSQVFDARAGAVQAHVAKLEAGPRFLLRTHDGEVEVHVTSELAEQNDRFARALAKRKTTPREAVSAFEAFALRYPSSPLTESALVERLRLLHIFDRPRGQAAAREYLARYPAGFAHGEAESIERDAP